MTGKDKLSRQEAILELAARKARVRVERLAARFKVSPMTIRRDLAELTASGKLSRTHGGAVPSRAGLVEFSFREKSREHAREKQAIAAAAARLVRPGMAVALDTGSTTLELARVLAGSRDLRVITTSLAIASVLHVCPDIEVILLGGTVRKKTPDLWGPVTEDNIRRFRTDLAVLGADAVTKAGAFTTDIRISRMSRAMIESARKAVLLADSSKFDREAFVQHAAFSEIDCLVTDSCCPKAVRRWLKKGVKEVMFAPVKSGGATRA